MTMDSGKLANKNGVPITNTMLLCFLLCCDYMEKHEKHVGVGVI